MRAFKSLFVVLLVVGHCSGARAQENWNKKPFTEWSKADTEKVLNDSPWARTQEVRSVYGLGPPTDFKFTLRLRSALPVREALVRHKQLEAKYERMSERDRAAFDARTKGLLDCPACADNYVLSLSSRSDNSPGWDLVFRSYEKMSLTLLQENVFLTNEKGEQRKLIHFIPPKAAGEEAVFFFPRRDDSGKPLIGPENKILSFHLSPQNAGSVKNFDVDVSKMILNGKVEF